MRTAAAEAPKPATAAETAEVGAPARPQAKVIERRDEAQKAGKTGLVARFDALLTTLARVDRAERLAAELARKVEELQRKSVELERRAARAVTLIEQTEARRARALARLQELGLNEKDALVVERQADIPVPAESPKGGTK